jgi:hypothetical protein
MMSQEDGQQQGLLGETYSELVNRLNDGTYFSFSCTIEIPINY